MGRIHNFSAGPAALPLPVLEKARDELLDFQNTGMSVMEMSHRGKAFDAVIKTAEANVRKLMEIPDEYSVLFLQGGASCQFAMIPMNLLTPGRSADYVHTGSWAGKAIKEAGITGRIDVIWDGKAENYARCPEPAELRWNDNAAYAHICTNETIGGIRFPVIPKTRAPLVADMSSEIMSRKIAVSDFGLIYAGAQKNLGPSGLAMVVIRKDLAERCPGGVNLFFRYRTHMEEPSLYNTPNTWAVYLLKLVTEWLLEKGGVEAMERINEEKAGWLYAALDSSPFWRPCAARSCRSSMNVAWRLPTAELEDRFVKEARAAGMDGLKGHRSVGGIRASIYNACPPGAVKALIQFMKEFERKNG